MMGALDRVFRSRRPSQQRPDEAVIAGLWRNGEQGGFMDPRDIDRYMAMRGPELFNAAAPSLYGESQNLGGGAVRVYTSAGAYTAITTPAGSTVPGKRYVVEGTVTAIGAAGAGLVVDSRENLPISALGPFRFVVTATVSYLAIKRNGAVPTDFTLSGVSIREWLGEASCTMWQDAVGTLPVVSAGQPIGLWLDKRKGLARGPELLTNGDFSAGAANWGVSGTDATHIATFANGALRYQSDTTSPVLLVSQSSVTTPGRWYEVTVTVSAWVSGGIKTDSFVQTSVPIALGLGTYRVIGLAAGSSFSFSRNSTNVDLTIDSISIRELPGNHAYMTTTTARATLSARYNLLTSSENFLSSSWNKLSGTTVSTEKTLVFADSSLSRITQNVSISGTVGVTMRATFSQGDVGKKVRLAVWGTGMDGFGLGSSGPLTIPSSGEVSYTWPSVTGLIACGLIIEGSISYSLTLAGGVDFRISNDGIGLPPYQRVTSATDYDTSGFPWYVLPDGVDDMFETAAVDMSGSAAITYATAVRRARDTGLGCIVEATNNYSTSNGTFILLAPGVSDTPSVAWNAKGTTLAGGMSISTATAPVSSVIVATANIETAERTLSVNDTSLTNSTSIGTGTLGNHKLYFFQRGSGGMAFSGRIYGWIWVARALSKAEINAIRRFFRTTARIY